MVEANTATRRKIVGKHACSAQLYYPISSEATAEYLHYPGRINPRLRPKHQRLADSFDYQRNYDLIARLNHLSRSTSPNMHNRFAKRLKDGQRAPERFFVSAHHNRERGGNRALISAAHRGIEHDGVFFSQLTSQRTRHHRSNRTHINHHQSRMRSLDNPTRA